MDHSGYARIVPNSGLAILFVHGIAGSPAHFRDLLPIIPTNCSVINLLLDGHGKDVKSFSNTSIEKWRVQVSSAVDNLLENHKRIIIAAHSMGTLFAIREAVNRPECISALFLLAVPLCPRVKLSALLNCIRLTQGWVPPDHENLIAMRNATSIQLDRRLWKYLGWLPRFIELLREARQVRSIVPRLQVPTYVFQSAHDELVSPASEKYLSRCAATQLTTLPGSGHYFYRADDLRLLQNQLKQLLNL